LIQNGDWKAELYCKVKSTYLVVYFETVRAVRVRAVQTALKRSEERVAEA
jgi:hypothetical protein